MKVGVIGGVEGPRGERSPLNFTGKSSAIQLPKSLKKTFGCPLLETVELLVSPEKRK